MYTLINLDNSGISLSPAQESISLATAMNSDSHFAMTSRSTTSNVRNTVLLSTALVDFYIGTQKLCNICCLVDTGSQASFITESCVQRLGLQRRKLNVPIYGIGDEKPVHPKGVVSISIKHTNADYPEIPLNAIILTKLIPKIPVCHT